ncbi:hypothetical protein ACFQFC_15965 [Amorphoplanes digitatis]|uniref:Uncharacterized protein n=1 Tax=Actinoplanes digitatis TaxID=1868 RepID=A0A7W7I3I8_9ACTN|nr:hypothetical protein [Actinoplanes digitatis]MBB4765707.1 hypothetical protein [Actinoplanes digitatis]GID98044.1 hypothetical protein Adi01nite_74560 [Actinoplanes digitatis]
MSALLTDVLQRACESEPLPGDDATADIVARADRLRRRSAWSLVLAGVATVGIVILLGYTATTVLLPGPKPPTTAAVAVPQPRPSGVLDPVLAKLAPPIDAKGYTIVPADPASGPGWRRYVVQDRDGAPRGMVEVLVFDAEAGLCLPVSADPSACALPDRTAAGVEYARYSTTDDVDWQVNQVIARRPVDGRTVAVMATGERGTGSAEAGEPPLTMAETAEVATDPHLPDAFGVGERCNRPAPSCPILKFPVRPSD